ncbi:MAG TPA: RNA polymerase sigma factor [Gemmatimonadales bacterium]|nr:RNA polymerase sigma factor [Gemmatimonadales bacterium]
MRGAIEAVATVSGVDNVVRRAQQGDVEAFEGLYRAHSAAIYALCRRMVGTDREALDLVQDIFVRAWERLTTFRGQSSLATWLHRLGVNVVLEHLRSAKRDASRFIEGDDTTFGGRSPAGQVDARIDLHAALVRLPGGARAVFVLHDIEGYSHEEIAQMTGIAPGTARAQLWRARRALLRLLDL